MGDDLTLGKIAFDAYSESTGGKTYNDRPIPPWSDISPHIQQAWQAAALAVVEWVNGPYKSMQEKKESPE